MLKKINEDKRLQYQSKHNQIHTFLITVTEQVPELVGPKTFEKVCCLTPISAGDPNLYHMQSASDESGDVAHLVTVLRSSFDLTLTSWTHRLSITHCPFHSLLKYILKFFVVVLVSPSASGACCEILCVYWWNTLWSPLPVPMPFIVVTKLQGQLSVRKPEPNCLTQGQIQGHLRDWPVGPLVGMMTVGSLPEPNLAKLCPCWSSILSTHHYTELFKAEVYA